MSDADALVVGGGVIGCAVARALARDREVRLLERDRIAAGATGRAAGEVTMTPAYSDLPSVAAHANAFFRDYGGADFVERPSLELVPPAREDEARRRVDRLADDEVPVAFLAPERVEDRYPRLSLAAFAGAVRYGETGFLDADAFTAALAADARERGATVETGVTVSEVLVEDGRVVGAATDDGERRAPTVVVAAGWRTEPLLRDVLRLPIRPYRTQCVRVSLGRPLDGEFPMGWVPGDGVYLRPTPDGGLLVVGGAVAVGSPAEAPHEVDSAEANHDADPAFRDRVLERLPRFLRDAADARIVDHWAGVDGATPDTRPIVDAPADAPEGLVAATGFHGRGVMTAPVAATAVRAVTTGGSAPFPLVAFALDRFESRSRAFPFYGIEEAE
ncbi:FAD-binding oxidoreductase [Halostella sp. JP-L12]|uniref:NAD(P)/FAD-dependent oxidoreductase n=1 Tax=Halostella TaxID=1843185 RepID=UPI000EF83A55|nr:MULTISPECIES: FAD-binding oxidoreductase [Halostella]NHN46140.1 FAD-binding oxidoreductase [Halostella sp. JP-L12]